MKFYNSILIAMKREGFFILAIIVFGMWMIIWSFFWWSKNSNEEIINNPWTWFTQELLNTWNDTTNNNAIDINTPITNNGYTTINVMMPKYFYNAWWKSFAEDLYTNQKVYMNFSFTNDLNNYRDWLINNEFSEIDLFLYPYDRNDNISTRTFAFQQDISSEFDPLISSIVKNPPVSFMPFAADPMIMYVLSGYSIQSTFLDIYNFVCDWSSKKPRSFPLFYWISDEDYDNKWFKREYQDIVRYALLHYFKTYVDSKSLSQRTSNNVFEDYKISDLNNISNALTTPECKNFPSICFQIYNFVWIRFGFLSDYDIVKQYFWNKTSDFNNLSKKVVPFFTVESPIRLWWWSMPSSLEDKDKINWVYAFLIQYMNDYNKYDLWWSTLSVFTDEWDELRYNNYIWKRWYILKTWWNYINYLKRTKLFRQLINYQISAEEYIRRA